MFPTLSELFYYLTGVHIALPLQTFGCVMVIAFAAAYWAYRSELKRKEGDGSIHPIERDIIPGRLSRASILLYASLAGWSVAKLIVAITHYRSFIGNPSRMLSSGVGNWWAGLATTLLVGGLMSYRRYQSRHQPTVRVVEHPYQMIDAMLWWCGLAGLYGAIFFHKLEHLPELLHGTASWWSFDGMSYYGGLLPGIAVAMFMARRRRIPLIHMVDMGSPAMILAYGIGRLGCHLSGDGDWGIVNTAPLPDGLNFLPSWAWAYAYPDSGQPVFPTSLYECILGILFFALLWSLRRRITVPGRLFAIYCILNGAERLLIEQIRVNPVSVFGMTQAELISSGFIVTGLFFLFGAHIRRKEVTPSFASQAKGVTSLRR